MTKNTLLLSVLFALSSVVNANVQTAAHDTKIFTFDYTVKPRNNDFTDWNNANTLLVELANKTTRANGNSFYQNILVFIKEMQEAIAAGLNLFGTISTSQESLSEIVQEVAVEAISDEAAAQAAEAATNAAIDNTKSVEQEAVSTDDAEQATEEVANTDVVVQDEEAASVEAQATPTITISLSVLSTDQSDEATWTTAKEMLQAFALEATTSEMSPADFVEKLTAIFEFIDQSSLHGSLQISSDAV